MFLKNCEFFAWNELYFLMCDCKLFHKQNFLTVNFAFKTLFS